VEDVQTHLEPLERPLMAEDATGPSDDAERERIAKLVLERTGHPPRELRLLQTDSGLVVFVSVLVGAGSRLLAAHELASALEEDIRAAQPHVADVVVHTEP
jgi:divalent metal cation (Fe/Co/Zn/Cd) transporter